MAFVYSFTAELLITLDCLFNRSLCVVSGLESAAVTLGTNESLLQQLMEWCKVEEHAGVKGKCNDA